MADQVRTSKRKNYNCRLEKEAFLRKAKELCFILDKAHYLYMAEVIDSCRYNRIKSNYDIVHGYTESLRDMCHVNEYYVGEKSSYFLVIENTRNDYQLFHGSCATGNYFMFEGTRWECLKFIKERLMYNFKARVKNCLINK